MSHVLRPGMSDPPRYRRHTLRGASGFTLLEALFVVAILSVVALLAMPDPAASEMYRLDLAAGQVADALRQARDEARRQHRAVEVSWEAPDVMQVYRVDDTTAPPVRIDTLREPRSRQPLVLDVAANPATRRVTVVSALLFDDVGARTSVFFAAGSIPAYLDSAGDRHRLLSGVVTLTLDEHVRRVRVDPLTGRITVQ